MPTETTLGGPNLAVIQDEPKGLYAFLRYRKLSSNFADLQVIMHRHPGQLQTYFGPGGAFSRFDPETRWLTHFALRWRLDGNHGNGTSVPNFVKEAAGSRVFLIMRDLAPHFPWPMG